MANRDISYALTAEQRSHFLAHGYVKVPSCFSRSAAQSLTSTLWTRLSYSATDKTKWAQERIHLPSQRSFPIARFAPKAWAAICDLLGGEERISEYTREWKDSFIVNLGKAEYEDRREEFQRKAADLRWLAAENWHVDGNFFWHYLDSREQALLVVPLFSDVMPMGGGTIICEDGIQRVARHLYEHPEGCTPLLKPRAALGEDFNFWRAIVKPSLERKESLYEMTGEVGDVFLLHPFMLHSASKNLLRNVRLITNPLVSLKQPFNLSRIGEDRKNYSLVEQKTLMELGLPDGVGNWTVEGERGRYEKA